MLTFSKDKMSLSLMYSCYLYTKGTPILFLIRLYLKEACKPFFAMWKEKFPILCFLHPRPPVDSVHIENIRR